MPSEQGHRREFNFDLGIVLVVAITNNQQSMSSKNPSISFATFAFIIFVHASVYLDLHAKMRLNYWIVYAWMQFIYKI